MAKVTHTTTLLDSEGELGSLTDSLHGRHASHKCHKVNWLHRMFYGFRKRVRRSASKVLDSASIDLTLFSEGAPKYGA